ncbi:lantibiotic dehydratase [Salinispora pacifica]|uniref:lantibiotic dehydratase n=1 Tax=Salinispora pacifica TaxID=351187 RepID=UPI0004ADB917|nr:lantibiotic dehydratase [Salinispora pacifica]
MRHSYELERPFVVRVAGLPWNVLTAGVQHRSWAQVQQLLDLDETIAGQADKLSDTLYEVIGRPALAAVKPRLVALRRTLYARRPPRPADWPGELRDCLPTCVIDDVEAFLSLLRQRAERSQRLREGLTAEAHGSMSALRDAAAAPALQRGLAQASPSLAAQSRRWVAGHLDRPRPRLLLGLAKYVSRAAAKTSPYSTFTSIALGEWSTGGALLRVPLDGPLRCVPELDRLVLGQVVERLLADPAIADRLPIRLNPSAVRGSDTVTFLGPRPDEAIRSVPLSPSLALCLDVVATEPGRFLGDLAALVAMKSGKEPTDVRPFLERLLHLGLIEARHPVTDQAPDPEGQLADWYGTIAATGRDTAPSEPGETFPDAERSTVAARLRRLHQTLNANDDPSDLAAHDRRQRLLVETVADVGNGLGLPWQPDDRLRKAALHENAVLVGRAQASAAAWEPVFDDLDVVRQWLGLHDRMLPVRIALDAYCATRFPDRREINLMEMYTALQHDLGAEPTADWSRFLQLGTPLAAEDLDRAADPRLQRLAELRRRSMEVFSAARRDGSSVVVAPERLAALAATWPAWVTTPPSISCYLQPRPTEDGLRAVVNVVSGGYGRGRGRWRRLAGSFGPAKHVAAAAADAHAVAELSGTFGVAMNLRAPTAPWEVDYPFTNSDRPGGQRIPFGELVVRRNSRSGLRELGWPPLRVPVLPAHTGLMADPLVPPAARFMFAAFGQSFFMHPQFPVVTVGEQHVEGIIRQPRIEVGRLTLQRARWIVPIDRIPVRQPGENDADHLVRLARWLRETGIPSRSYIRTVTEVGPWQTRVFDKARKPMYIDVTNPWLLSVLEHVCSPGSGSVAFEEALPAPLAHDGTDGDARVTEMIIELSERRQSV